MIEKIIGVIVCFIIAAVITKLLMLLCDCGCHNAPKSPCKDCKCTDCGGCKYAR